MTKDARHVPLDEKDPQAGIASARSEKAEKVAAHRRERRALRSRLQARSAAEALTGVREPSDIWNFAKDGKQYLGKVSQQDLRKQSTESYAGEAVVKKRLRRKRNRSEYAEWGRQVLVDRTRKEDSDAFTEAFILEAIEGNGCFCGRRGKKDRPDVPVELGKIADDHEGRIQGIRVWLCGRNDVAASQIGPQFDLCDGECPDLAEQLSATAAPLEAPG